MKDRQFIGNSALNHAVLLLVEKAKPKTPNLPYIELDL